MGVDRATAQGVALTQRLAKEPGVTDVVSYWTAGQPITMKSKDGTQAMVLARLTGNQDDAVNKAKALGKLYDGEHDGLTIATGGEFAVYAEVGDTIERDVIRAESIAIPITAVLLVLVFGSAIAATLPLLIGVLSILGTFLALHLLVGFTEVSVYSVNLATSMGLGLGIDYGLFMVTRFREELRRGHPVPDAVRETMRTAGRTVMFSAVTVALSLGALLVFPLFFLKSFAYAGISAVLFALHRCSRRAARSPGGSRRTGQLARPAPAAAAGTADVAAAGEGARRGLLAPDRRHRHEAPDRSRYGGSAAARPARAALQERGVRPAGRPRAARRRAGSRGGSGAARGLPRTGGLRHARDPRAQQRRGRLRRGACRGSSGVERVDTFSGRYMAGRKVAPGNPALTPAGQASRLSVVPAIESIGPAGERLARALRDVPPPSPVLIGGQASDLLDTKASLGSKLPLAVGLVFIATFILLFLFTGSLVIPVKALVLNVLSLSATFGMMVWIFQEGHLTNLLGNPAVTGTLDTTMPILMFCVLFGLSMDYEVFLLSRIKEEWDATGDNTRAVAVGLERTGSLVTAAAGLLALVFLAFVTSDIAFIKLLGLGTALAVVVDATLVRGALVPAFMRLMGDAQLVGAETAARPAQQGRPVRGEVRCHRGSSWMRERRGVADA